VGQSASARGSAHPQHCGQLHDDQEQQTEQAQGDPDPTERWRWPLSEHAGGKRPDPKHIDDAEDRPALSASRSGAFFGRQLETLCVCGGSAQLGLHRVVEARQQRVKGGGDVDDLTVARAAVAADSEARVVGGQK
jgi:hypothetical protein